MGITLEQRAMRTLLRKESKKLEDLAREMGNGHSPLDHISRGELKDQCKLILEILEKVG